MATTVEIRDMLANMGVSPHMKGFNVCAEAIRIATDEPEIMFHVTGELYPRLARKFGTTVRSVERNIQSAIYWMYDTSMPEQINRYTNIPCSPQSGYATNSVFIAAVARYIRDSRKALPPLNHQRRQHDTDLKWVGQHQRYYIKPPAGLQEQRRNFFENSH